MPPPYYVKCARTAAWLRLGKIAVFSILAGLAVAVGMAFSDGNDAEAQGVRVRAGYTYTARFCQELGQQARRYNVRDPIPGSDWRNDGGWAIILVGGVATSYTFGYATYIASRPIVEVPARGVSKTRRTDIRAGQTGFLRLFTDGRPYGSATTHRVVIDRNKDGEIDDADRPSQQRQRMDDP